MRHYPIFNLLLPYIFGIFVWNWLDINLTNEIILLVFCFSLYFWEQAKKPLIGSAKKIWIFCVVLFAFAIGYHRSIDAFGGYVRNVNYVLLENDCITAKVLSSDKSGEHYNRLMLEAISLNDEIAVKGRFLAMIETDEILEIDDVIQLKNTPTPIVNNGNPGEFDAKAYWKSKNIHHQVFVASEFWVKIGKVAHSMDYYFHTWRKWCCDQFAIHLQGQNLAVAQALVFGDRGNVDNETLQSFADTGAMHVLAVSGLHIGIVLVFLEFLFIKVFRLKSKKRGIIYSLLIIWFYCLLTGFSASVARSVVMFTVLSIGRLYQKEENNLNSLGVSAFILLLWDPAFIYDIGFQLSYLAMIGIFWFYQPILDLYSSSNIFIRYIWEGTAVGFAAQLLTVPLSLYYFHQFPNYFALTNIGLMVYSFLILAIGLLLLLFSKVPIVNLIFAKLLFVTMVSMFFILSLIQNIPGAVSYGFEVNMYWIIAMYGFIFLFWLIYENKEKFHFLKYPIIGFCILIVLMAVQRYKNHDEKRIIIFADTKNMISFHSNQQHICLYDGYLEKNLVKAKKVMNNCVKVYPGDITFLKLPYFEEASKISIDQDHFVVKRNDYGYLIQKNSKNFITILTKEHFNISSKHVIRNEWVDVDEGTLLDKFVVIKY
jgi:competence protein ComEC